MPAAAETPRTSGMTLVEGVLSIAILGAVMSLVLAATTASSRVLNVSQAQTRAHVEAERCARFVADQLRASGLAAAVGGLSISASGLQAGAPGDRVSYEQVLGPDPADPLDLRLGPRRTLAFEADGAELLGNGKDDDGDLLVDEGRLVLRQGAALVAVVAQDVSRFGLTLEPASPGGLDAVRVEVTVEHPIRAAVTDEKDVARAAAGGIRARHVARAVVSLQN